MLSTANTHLKNRNYTEAIRIYQLLFDKYPAMRKIFESNMQLAKTRMKNDLSVVSNEFDSNKFFDYEFYIKNNGDVANAGANPWDHYLNDGWLEGRSPSPILDFSEYDTKNIGSNPLQHYYAGGFKNKLITKQCVPDWLVSSFDMSVADFFTNNSSYCNVGDGRKYDIIIPVYNGYEYLEKLFDSILKNTTCPYRLIIGNDCSPDPRVDQYLNNFIKINKSTDVLLINNTSNLGFVRNVNKLVAYAETDFVLLNTDVEVPKDWLQRLFFPMIINDDVASTTPFSNAATIFSFPNYIVDNEIYKNLSVDAIDGFFKKVNFDKTHIPVPTGVGFCMGVSKKIADKIGMFDEAYGKGYSEENDWCMRAMSHGFRHIHVTNLFVYHKHGGSFDEEVKKRLQSSNYKELLSRYPQYDKLVASTVNSNQLNKLRRAVKNNIDFHIIKDNESRFKSLRVFYVGHLTSSSGVGEAARGYVKALLAKGVEIVCFDLSRHDWMINFKALFGWQLPSSVVWHMTAKEMLEFSVENSNFLLAVKKTVHSIGVWAWESDEYNSTFGSASQFIHEIWAISTYVSIAFEQTKVTQNIIPHVIESVTAKKRKNIARVEEIKENFSFIVGYIFDFRSCVFRKNPYGVIDAYSLAFEKNENACLILKVSGVDDFKADYEELLSYIKNKRNVFILNENYDRDELNYLFSIFNVYLALFRAEGFGLTIAEAVAMKVPVICTRYSGVMDFLTESDSVYLVDYNLIDLPDDWGPYKKGLKWANPNLIQAADFLGVVYEKRNEKKTNVSLQYLNAVTSMENVGSLCINSLLLGFLKNHIYYKCDRLTNF